MGCSASLSKFGGFKILILGLDGAGGTSILYRIKLHEIIAPAPTHEFNVETKHHHHIELTFWDVGGSKKLRHLWSYYYPGIQVVFYVVDAHNKERLQESKEEFYQVLQDTLLESVPILILANKQDLSGSTALLYKLRLGQVVTTIPTIGFNVENVRYKSAIFTLWDIGGQEKIRSLWRHYVSGTNVIVFVVDAAKRERFPEALVALRELLKKPDLKGVPFIILANKQDIEGAASKDEVMLGLELIYINDRKWFTVETSITTGQGLSEFIETLFILCKSK